MRYDSTDDFMDSGDGNFGPSGTRGGRVRVWLLSWGLKSLIPAWIFGLVWLSSREPTRMQLTRGQPGVLTLGFALSADGKSVATTDSEGRVALREIQNGWGTERFLDYRGLAKGVAFSPNGRFLALGGVEPDLFVFDLAHGGARRLRNASTHQTEALAFSPDGRTLAATTNRNGDIILWDLDLDRVRTTFHGHSPALCLAFSPDGRTLASGERDEQRVSLWDLETVRSRLLLRQSHGPIFSVAFSPDGSLLAAASPVERTVRIWDLRTGRLCRQIAGHIGGTNSVSFSPDGGTLATAGNDGMVRLWSVATGAQRTQLDGQSSWLPKVAFSADGRTLAACGGDNHVRLWDLDEIFRNARETAGSSFVSAEK
jgi:WD40 repeat protein